MKLYDVDVTKILPAFMRKDSFNLFLSNYISEIIKEHSKNLKKLSVWNFINELNDEECDLFAWELNLNFYNTTDSLTIKRNNINSAINSKLQGCTPKAIEKALQSYAKSGGTVNVIEWFQSNNNFNSFYIELCNPGIFDLNQFLKTLSKIVRKSSVLKGLIIREKFNSELYVACCAKKETKRRFEIEGNVNFSFFTSNDKYLITEKGSLLIQL